MVDAIIGHTGFVGGNLLRQNRFDACFNSRNIESIKGNNFQLLVCCGAPAVKWIANKNPDADWTNLSRLMSGIAGVQAERVVLISTVDVYSNPRGVDEESVIDHESNHSYGRNRRKLEIFMQDRFDSCLVVRLPGLFGRGIKKNVVYDLLHNNEVHKIQPDSVFQFYFLDRLWGDIRRFEEAGLCLVNLATEPFSVFDLGRTAFGIDIKTNPETPSITYDFRTQYDSLFGGKGGYLYSKEEVLMDLKSFVAEERKTI